MVAIELLDDGAAPGEPRDVRRSETDRLDHGREAARVVGQTEVSGHIGGAARPRLVPGHDRELVSQGGELRTPHPAVLCGAVHEYQRRTLPDAFADRVDGLVLRRRRRGRRRPELKRPTCPRRPQRRACDRRGKSGPLPPGASRLGFWASAIAAATLAAEDAERRARTLSRYVESGSATEGCFSSGAGADRLPEAGSCARVPGVSGSRVHRGPPRDRVALNPTTVSPVAREHDEGDRPGQVRLT
jgi:hypothetical protein